MSVTTRGLLLTFGPIAVMLVAVWLLCGAS